MHDNCFIIEFTKFTTSIFFSLAGYAGNSVQSDTCKEFKSSMCEIILPEIKYIIQLPE